jgi:hypothetical protein
MCRAAETQVQRNLRGGTSTLWDKYKERMKRKKEY